MLYLQAQVRLQGDELDVVRGDHGVGDGADRHVYPAALDSDYGDVLFTGGVGGVGFELGHGLAAAHDGNALVHHEIDYVAAVAAAVKFCHNYTPIRCIGPEGLIQV